MKRLLCVLLVPLLVLMPCFAAETAVESTVGGYDITIPADWTMAELMQYFIDTYGLTERNFAISVCCPDTGERFDFNELQMMFAASTYKLPLNLYYYERQVAGEFDENTYVGGVPLSSAHYQSIVLSNNEISEAMIYRLGSFYQYKKLMNDSYGHLDEADLDANYWGNNYYCTKFMENTLEYLYAHIEQFEELVGYLKQAMPGQYLQEYAGDVEVGHKYGFFYDTVNSEHDVGILFTEQPVLVAIYTESYYGGGIGAQELIGRLGKALINYQTQRTALDRQAQAQAEAEALAAAEAAQESERQAREAEQAAKIVEADAALQAQLEQQAAEREQAAQAQAEAEQAAQAQASQQLLLYAAIGAGALALLVTVLLLLRRKRS